MKPNLLKGPGRLLGSRTKELVTLRIDTET